MPERTVEQIARTAAWAHRCLKASDMDGLSAQNFLADLLVVLAERERLLREIRSIALDGDDGRIPDALARCDAIEEVVRAALEGASGD